MKPQNHNQCHPGSPRWSFQRFFTCAVGNAGDELTAQVAWFANKDGIRHALRATFAGKTHKMVLPRTPKHIDLITIADEVSVK